MKKINIDQEQLLKRITSLLQETDIPYMITGAISVIFYGRPRASHDIDFVVEAHKRDINRVIQAFSLLPNNEFLVDSFAIKDAIMKKFIFQILHLPTMLKFDYAEKQSKKVSFKGYALDDNCAIKVVDNNAQVISEGQWKKFR